MFFKTDNFTIDKIRSEEIKIWYALLNDPNSYSEYSNNTIPDIRQLESIYSECEFINDEKGSHFFIFSANRKLHGVLTLIKVDEKNFEVGFKIFLRNNRSQGIMNEIFPRFIDYIKETRSAQTLIARCIDKNIPAIKLLRSNGFLYSNSECILFKCKTYSHELYALRID